MPTIHEKVFPVSGLGQVNDWRSISGNKVLDVKYLNDGKYIYLPSDYIPEIIKFDLILNTFVISSEPYFPPEFPNIQTLDFVTANAPGMPGTTGWTTEQFQEMEIEVADNTFDQMQGFQAFVPNPIVPWNIVAAGLRATIQFGAQLDQIEIRVLKLEKLLKHL